ncbi:hypothetical protein D3C72_1533630 [compost metagenome]
MMALRRASACTVGSRRRSPGLPTGTGAPLAAATVGALSAAGPPLTCGKDGGLSRKGAAMADNVSLLLPPPPPVIRLRSTVDRPGVTTFWSR